MLQTPRLEDFHQHTLAGQEARKAKLPSIRALEGVADIYSTHAKDSSDRLRAAALALLVVTGFRIGELLSLPLECEVTEISEGKPRYGLRYYREKARGAERMFDVRWLTTTGAELARAGIAEIQQLTAPAREQAKILEQHANRVPIPGYQWADRMPPDEVLRVTGFKSRRSVYQISRDKLPRHQEGDVFFYRAGEVEAYLLTERVDLLWTLDRRDGTYQMLSETLFIAFQNSFHTARCPCPLLVEPMTAKHLNVFLAGERGTRSAVERPECLSMRGLTPQGEAIRFPSHDSRKTRTPNREARWVKREEEIEKSKNIQRVDTPSCDNTSFVPSLLEDQK